MIFPTLDCKCVDWQIYRLESIILYITHYTVVRSNSLKHLLGAKLGQESKRPLYIHMRSHEKLKLLRFQQVGTPNKLLEEHIQIEAASLNEILTSITNLLLWWNRRNIHSWMSHTQSLSQKVELFEPPLNFIWTVSVDTNNSVNDMCLIWSHTWITNRESLGKFIWWEWPVDR